MRVRNGFVSNSSSCSFVVSLDTLTRCERDYLLDMRGWEVGVKRQDGKTNVVGDGASYDEDFDNMPSDLFNKLNMEYH